MQPVTLSGVNATISIDHTGVKITHSLTRRVKTIAWGDVGGATIQAGNWLTRPKLFVVTKELVVRASSGWSHRQRQAGDEAADWYVVVPMGQDAQFQWLKEEINRRTVAGIMALSPGDDVMVAWSDGQKYPARFRANQGGQLAVVFPSGAEMVVAPEHVTRA